MNLHPSVEQAFEEIDAALFTGDTFIDKENRQYLIKILNRWILRAYVCAEIEYEIKLDENQTSCPTVVKDLVKCIKDSLDSGEIGEEKIKR
jgi:hypothetical protein